MSTDYREFSAVMHAPENAGRKNDTTVARLNPSMLAENSHFLWQAGNPIINMLKKNRIRELKNTLKAAHPFTAFPPGIEAEKART